MTRTKYKVGTLLAAIALTAATAAPALAAESIYDTLKADPQFSTLVKVIDANDVKYQYTAKSTRTVFAPTNDAFDKIKGGYDDMVSPSNPSDKQNVQALLLYEIVPGSYTPESLEGKKVSVTTFQKDPVTIDGTGPKLHFGGDYGAMQSGAVITATNGIIVPVDTLPTPVFSQTDDETGSQAPASTDMAPASGTLTAPK